MLPRIGEVQASNGYARSKLLAEKVVERARKRHGLPVLIVRTGAVWADMKTGFCPSKDFFTRYIRACIQMKSMPSNDQLRELSPVDVVIDTAMKTTLSRASSSTSITDQHVFHILSTEGRTNHQFARMVEQLGFGRIGVVPQAEWTRNLKNIPNSPLAPFISWFEEDPKLTAFSQRMIEKTASSDDAVNIPVSTHNVSAAWPPASQVLAAGLKFLKAQGLLTSQK
jgi:thioester reductase-like protein